MNEHEQILAIIEAKNRTPVALPAAGTALIVVDMQRYFTQPGHPFTDVFDKLSPGASAGYLARVRETVVPNIAALLERFRAVGAPVVFTAVGTEEGEGRDLPHWLRAFDQLGPGGPADTTGPRSPANLRRAPPARIRSISRGSREAPIK